MKIYIVMKGFWMYQTEIDKVFKDHAKAKNYLKQLYKEPLIHAYIIEKEIEK